MALSDSACRNAKPNGEMARKLTDAQGLYLFIAPTGSKTWRIDYRHDGKRKTATLGTYPKVSLATARALREALKDTLAAGRDPSKQEVGTDGAVNPFVKVAGEWFEAQKVQWDPKHFARIFARFRRDVFPKIGEMDIAQIEAPDLLKVIRAVEDRGAHDIASRIHQTCGAIFRFGIATGICKRDPAADLKGALRPAPRVEHRSALSEKDLPAFLRDLGRFDGEPQTALALRLTIHTALRTNEIRFGKWHEIDGDLWRIPAERMKMGRDHIIPLSKQVLEILDKLKTLSNGSEWVVTTAKGKPISENRMLYAVYRMGLHTKATVHGFRSTFSTIANESELWSADAIEMALAHAPTNAIRSAYNRGTRLEERRRLMQWWSDYLDKKSVSATDLTAFLTESHQL